VHYRVVREIHGSQWAKRVIVDAPDDDEIDEGKHKCPPEDVEQARTNLFA